MLTCLKKFVKIQLNKNNKRFINFFKGGDNYILGKYEKNDSIKKIRNKSENEKYSRKMGVEDYNAEQSRILNSQKSN